MSSPQTVTDKAGADSPTLLKGWVIKDELASRGFALVQLPGTGPVLVHITGCYKASRNFRTPKLGTQKDSPTLSNDGPGGNAWVVMEGVHHTEKGWRAMRWGVLPNPDDLKDLKDLLRDRGIAYSQYVGGHISITGRRHGEQVWAFGTIERVQIDLGRGVFEVEMELHETDRPNRPYWFECSFIRMDSSVLVTDTSNPPELRLELVFIDRLTITIRPPIG